MKTFLWTSLFWIIAVIAGLLCLGFGNLGTQVLDNYWISSIMPKNLKSPSCESVVASAMENIDWCSVAEDYDCDYEDVENEEKADIRGLYDSLNILSANQETIYNQMNASFNQMNESFTTILKNLSDLVDMYNSLNTNESAYVESVIDEREQQRLQLQAQIDALQNEMAKLY